MKNKTTQSKYYSRFLPITQAELPKFLFSSLLFGLITFNYGLLRGLKDTFINGQGGPVLISALKLFGVLPSMVIFWAFFNFVSNVSSARNRFNIVVGYFIGFFVLFVTFLYPLREQLYIDWLTVVGFELTGYHAGVHYLICTLAYLVFLRIVYGVLTSLYALLKGDFSWIGQGKSLFISIVFLALLLTLFVYGLGGNLVLTQLNLVELTADGSKHVLKRLFMMVRCWHYSFFYINAEAWGTFVLSVVYWGFINRITGIEQSRRFFAPLAISANIGTMIAGGILYPQFISPSFTILGVVLVAITILVVYNLFQNRLDQDPKKYQVEEKPVKKKVSMGPLASIKFLYNCPDGFYLSLVATIVLGYSMCVTLLEVVFRSQLKAFAGVQAKKMIAEGSELPFATLKYLILKKYAGVQFFVVGFMAILLVFTADAYTRKQKWGFRAMLMPVIFSIGALVAFGCYYSIPNLVWVVGSMLFVVVMIKSCKYIFFDASKEQSYIPLDGETKSKGKAAVDGVGSRFGKAVSSFLVTFFIDPIWGSVDASSWVFVLLIVIFLIAWIFAVYRLTGMYEARVKKKEAATVKNK